MRSELKGYSYEVRAVNEFVVRAFIYRIGEDRYLMDQIFYLRHRFWNNSVEPEDMGRVLLKACKWARGMVVVLRNGEV